MDDFLFTARDGLSGVVNDALIRLCLFVCLCLSVCLSVCLSLSLSLSLSPPSHSFTDTRVRGLTHTHTHTRTHTHTHTHTHTRCSTVLTEGVEARLTCHQGRQHKRPASTYIVRVSQTSRPRRRNVTTSMIGIKKVAYSSISPKNEQQRYS